MKLTTRLIGAAAVLMTLAIIPARADTPAQGASDQSFQSLITGAVTPSTMKLKDLDGSWRRLTLGGPIDSGHWIQLLSSYLGTPNPSIVYTKGQTTTIGGVTYLAVYRPLFDGPGIVGIMTAASSLQPPQLPKLTADTTISMSLLDMKTIGNLDDIRAFDLLDEVAESDKMESNIMTLVSLLQALVAKNPVPSRSMEHMPWHPAPGKKKPAH